MSMTPLVPHSVKLGNSIFILDIDLACQSLWPQSSEGERETPAAPASGRFRGCITSILVLHLPNSDNTDDQSPATITFVR
jgi:hypothetical protein